MKLDFKKAYPSVCISALLISGVAQTQVHAQPRNCQAATQLINGVSVVVRPAGVVCGNEHPGATQVIGQCALIGASFDQNGHFYVGNNYEATLGFVLAKQTPMSKLRWYTEAASGMHSSDYLRQMEVVELRMNNENKVWPFVNGLNCVVIGPTGGLFDAPVTASVNHVSNIHNVVKYINDHQQSRTLSTKVKIFIADYPPANKLQFNNYTEYYNYQENLGMISYAFANSDSSMNSDIEFYDSASVKATKYATKIKKIVVGMNSKVELVGGSGIINVWNTNTFATRQEMAGPEMVSGTQASNPDRNDEHVYKFLGASPTIHPNLSTVCAAANRVTTSIYNAYGLVKPVFPANSNLCPGS